jgi:hypothetical protein
MRLLFLNVAFSCVSFAVANIGAAPTRVDLFEITATMDQSTLTALNGATVLDTGLLIQSNVCDGTPDFKKALRAAFASVKEIRGWVVNEMTSCELDFLPALAVVRADMRPDTTPGIDGINKSPFTASPLQYVDNTPFEQPCPHCGLPGCAEPKTLPPDVVPPNVWVVVPMGCAMPALTASCFERMVLVRIPAAQTHSNTGLRCGTSIRGRYG